MRENATFLKTIKSIRSFLCNFAVMKSHTLSQEETRNNLRNSVIHLAMQAFYSRGIKSVTMDEIAHELSISKRTLYQVFTDKEELLDACIEEHSKQHREQMLQKMQQTDNVLELILFDLEVKFDRLRDASPLFLTDLARYPRIMEKLETLRQQQCDHAVAFLSKGVEQGLFLPNVNYPLFYECLTHRTENLIEQVELKRYRPIDVFLHLAVYSLRGIATLKGVQMMDSFLAAKV